MPPPAQDSAILPPPGHACTVSIPCPCTPSGMGRLLPHAPAGAAVLGPADSPGPAPGNIQSSHTQPHAPGPARGGACTIPLAWRGGPGAGNVSPVPCSSAKEPAQPLPSPRALQGPAGWGRGLLASCCCAACRGPPLRSANRPPAGAPRGTLPRAGLCPSHAQPGKGVPGGPLPQSAAAGLRELKGTRDASWPQGRGRLGEEPPALRVPAPRRCCSSPWQDRVGPGAVQPAAPVRALLRHPRAASPALPARGPDQHDHPEG